MSEYTRNEIVTGDARALAASIPDASVDLVFTDPVYDRIEDYRWLAETAARVLKPGGALLAYLGISYLPAVMVAMAGVLPYRSLIVHHLLGGKNYVSVPHKTIYNGSHLLWFGGAPHTYTGIVWDSTPNNGLFFKWQKSVQLITRHITDFTTPGALVYDPFAGGGTVPAVCKMLGRDFLASEIDPETAARARERLAHTQPPLPGLVVEQMTMEAA